MLRCLTWCSQQGHIRHVLLYDPSGTLKAELGDAAAQSNVQFDALLKIHVISAADSMQPLLDLVKGPILPTVASSSSAAPSPLLAPSALAEDLPSDAAEEERRRRSLQEGGGAEASHPDIFSCAIDPAVVDSELQRSGPAWATLRPEVAFVLGPMLSLAGFPPWNSTKMEILHLGDVDRVTEKTLTAAMNKYRRTQQRFGR